MLIKKIVSILLFKTVYYYVSLLIFLNFGFGFTILAQGIISDNT